jgi:hypothetical protein
MRGFSGVLTLPWIYHADDDIKLPILERPPLRNVTPNAYKILDPEFTILLG